jgi:hypothetical protein
MAASTAAMKRPWSSVTRLPCLQMPVDTHLQQVAHSSPKAEDEIAPELTGHGLPLSKCEAYNRVYDQF